MTDAFMHQHRTLVGPQRFISGSVVLSPNCSLAQSVQTSCGLAKLLASVKHGCTVYVHRWAIPPALRWRSSEREKKLTNRVAASSFFQNFRPLDLRSPTDLSHYPDRSLIEGTWWTAPFPRPARFNREVLHSVRRKFLDGMLRSGCEFRKLIPQRSLKRSIETEFERNSVDQFRKVHSLVQWY